MDVMAYGRQVLFGAYMSTQEWGINDEDYSYKTYRKPAHRDNSMLAP